MVRVVRRVSSATSPMRRRAALGSVAVTPRVYYVSYVNVRIPAGVLIGLGAAASLLSGFVRREPSQTNDFVWLFPLEVVGTLLIGAAAVIAQRRQATAIGLYVLLVAAAIATLFPLWLPEDGTVP